MMKIDNLINNIAVEISRANDASGANASTVHDAITALIESNAGGSGGNILTGSFTVTGGATKSVTHNAGWRRYVFIAYLVGEPTTSTNEYRSIYSIAYVNMQGVNVPPNKEHNTFFGAQRLNVTTGAYSTGSTTLNTSTENVCFCVSNAMIGGDWEWICIQV